MTAAASGTRHGGTHGWRTAFDGRSFEQLLDDLEGLAGRARDHEHRLATLINLLDRAAQPPLAAESDVGASPSAHPAVIVQPPATCGSPADMLPMLRDACISARYQRLLVESLCARLFGVVDDGGCGSGPHGRALVVDDSEDNRDLAATILEGAGFHTLTASNGLEGVIVAHYARPAIVLMDLTMPVLDGVEAARLLRASVVTRHLKLIAYTARADAYDGQLAFLFTHVLSKPAPPDAIVAAVKRFAVRPDSRASAGSAT